MATVFNVLYLRLRSIETVATLCDTRIWEGEPQDNNYPRISIETDQEADNANTARPAPLFSIVVKVEALSDADRNAIVTGVLAALNRQQWQDDENAATVAYSTLQNENRSSETETGNVERTYFTSTLTFDLYAKL